MWEELLSAKTAKHAVPPVLSPISYSAASITLQTPQSFERRYRQAEGHDGTPPSSEGVPP